MGTPQVRENDVLCSNSNEHEKKVQCILLQARAKYKVVDTGDDEEILVYCSKCAINLIKKGFKVDDLTPEDIYAIKNQERHNETNEYHDYAEQTRNKLKIKFNELCQQKETFTACYNKELEDVNCYYESIISLLQQQQQKDRESVLAHREKVNDF